MRVISHRAFRQLAPILIWAHDKEVGPFFDRLSGQAMQQMVWRIDSEGAAAGTRHLAPLRPGDWVFGPRGPRVHSFLPGTRIRSIGYRVGQTGIAGGWFDHAGVVVLRDCHDLDRATDRLLDRLRVENNGQTGPLARLNDLRCSPEAWLRIHAEFLLWLTVVAATLEANGYAPEGTSEYDSRVAAALDLLASDPWSADRDPSQLARSVGVSRRRLEQLFRTEMGSGVAEQRRLQQLRFAAAALDQPGRQIKEVAHQLGFASASAFSTWFRRRTGRSPATYRGTLA